ncbi:MAG: ABC transporter substrate-binding protein [Patescibacteria group bacterium]
MSKNLKITLGVVVIVILILILSASKTGDSQKIKVGVISILSGPFADYGEEIRKGVLSVASSTDKVEFVFEDDKCEPKEAVSAYKKLVDFDKVKIIIGPACGSPQEAIIPLIEENKTIVLVPSAASRSLYTQSGDNFFNVQYSLEDESSFMGEKMNELGYKKAALVTYKNAFSETHAKAFKESFKGEIVHHVLTDNTSDVSTEIAKIKAEKPDAIYSPDVAFFFSNGLIKIRQYGIVVPVYGTYVVELPAARPLVQDIYYSFPGDLTGQSGAVYELSKQAALIAIEAVTSCNDSALCIKSKIGSSGKFDEFGVYKRPIILKQIK